MGWGGSESTPQGRSRRLGLVDAWTVHEGDARSVRALAAEPLEVEGEQRVVEPVPTGEEGDVAHAKQRVAVVEHLIVHVDVERARRPAGAPPRARL